MGQGSYFKYAIKTMNHRSQGQGNALMLSEVGKLEGPGSEGIQGPTELAQG